MATSQARDRLLAAAIEQALHGGIIGQSLRQIATAIGTSHRMLLYHFGSREGLLVAICNAFNEAYAGALDRWEDPRGLFEHFTNPEMWPWERLFIELYAHALSGGPGSEEFFEASVHRWITGIADELMKAGVDEVTAGTEARLQLAVARGLLLDLLATGEREEVHRAYEAFLRRTGHPATRAPRPLSPSGPETVGLGTQPPGGDASS